MAVRARSGVGVRRPGDFGELAASAGQAFTGGAGQVLAKPVPCGGSAGDNQCSLRFFPVFPA